VRDSSLGRSETRESRCSERPEDRRLENFLVSLGEEGARGQRRDERWEDKRLDKRWAER
jgi:hypothetical protein